MGKTSKKLKKQQKNQKKIYKKNLNRKKLNENIILPQINIHLNIDLYDNNDNCSTCCICRSECNSSLQNYGKCGENYK